MEDKGPTRRGRGRGRGCLLYFTRAFLIHRRRAGGVKRRRGARTQIESDEMLEEFLKLADKVADCWGGRHAAPGPA